MAFRKNSSPTPLFLANWTCNAVTGNLPPSFRSRDSKELAPLHVAGQPVGQV